MATAACPEPDGSSPQQRRFSGPPPMCIDPNKRYTATMETTKGTLTIALDAASAPKTVNNFVFLARYHYFDGIVFHRIIPGFVIQGGDPTGTGSGGPGYQTVDPPPSDAQYTQGVVAMAKTGLDPPGTAGSQFFVVTGQDAGLPADYAIVGEVTEGLDAVLAIDRLGVSDGPPSEPVVIERVTVQED